ncbi:MAG: ABC transporter ATP-binding protein [Chlorobi bacterium]|nr:ABC transporter ATP-binding protein [Chlorobiota bacterium]
MPDVIDQLKLSATGLSKQFNRRKIFHELTFTVGKGEVFGITGKNGSGKSTLLRILAGVLTPNSGSVEFRVGGAAIDPEKVIEVLGYAAPYLMLYEEFTALENIRFFSEVRGLPFDTVRARDLLDRVGLPSDRRDVVHNYSSGMKQRLKLVFAILHQPPFLFLDEPTTNLDQDGIEVVYSLIEEQRRHGCVLIATNDATDITRCDRLLDVTTGEVSEAAR